MKGPNIEKKIRGEESLLFAKADRLYVNSKKDATLETTEKGGVQHKQALFEKHYVLVDEPGEYYLSHILTTSEKGRDIAEGIKNAIINTDFEDTLTVIGTDSIAAMTGRYNGAIRCLEECLRDH